MISAAVASTAFSALIWWAVPVVALLGAFTYVIWVSKFQDKFHNETNRSVTKFQSFQDSFRESKPVILIPQNETDTDPADPTVADDLQKRGE